MFNINVELARGPPFILAEFPEDYKFYRLKKTHSGRPDGNRTDLYLRSVLLNSASFSSLLMAPL